MCIRLCDVLVARQTCCVFVCEGDPYWCIRAADIPGGAYKVKMQVYQSTWYRTAAIVFRLHRLQMLFLKFVYFEIEVQLFCKAKYLIYKELLLGLVAVYSTVLQATVVKQLVQANVLPYDICACTDLDGEG